MLFLITILKYSFYNNTSEEIDIWKDRHLNIFTKINNTPLSVMAED